MKRHLRLYFLKVAIITFLTISQSSPNGAFASDTDKGHHNSKHDNNAAHLNSATDKINGSEPHSETHSEHNNEAQPADPNAKPTPQPTLIFQGIITARILSTEKNALSVERVETQGSAVKVVHPAPSFYVYTPSKTTFWIGKKSYSRRLLKRKDVVVIHALARENLIVARQVIVVPENKKPDDFLKPNKQRK